ncbi:MAG: hypothetical protein CO065_07240 [Comamonadaceae bacterium CG_4_9_14_0_8_um_filter_57_21]|nr:MAG: hypothetical protein CO065_07240 [Comamonadaceae bacterium CG_4_9_14_0_8_um_filter_57_21]
MRFKAVYLRVLLGGAPQPQDWWAAKELIDSEHASGKYLLSQGRQNHGQVMNLLGFAPTLKGRLLADDLAEQILRQGWRYRLVQAAIGLCSFGSGWLLGVTTEVGKAYVTRFFGL